MRQVKPALVTTVIAVYNRPQLIVAAVTSVLAQSYRPIEVIVVDDGSTDGTGAVCDSLAAAHPAIVQVLHRPNGGLGRALNAGLGIARGEFIQFLDSDDLIMPEKFAMQVAALRDHPECGLSYCYVREYVLGEPWSGRPARRSGETFERLFPALVWGKIWPAPAPLYRRAVVDANGPFLEVSVQLDWEYECRMGSRGVRLHHCRAFLADLRGTHRAEGRSKGGATGQQLRDYALVIERVFRHAQAAGVSLADADILARLLFAASRKCAAAGYEAEARRCLKLAECAARPWRRLRIAGYGALSALAGWSPVGRLFEIGDRSRTMTAMRAVRRQPRAIFDLWRHRAREAALTVSGHPLGRWPGLLWHRWQHRRSLTLGGRSGAARMPAGRGGS